MAEIAGFKEPKPPVPTFDIGIANKESPKHPNGSQDFPFAAELSSGRQVIAGVCDGVGGYEQGDVAAALLGEAVLRTFEDDPPTSYEQFQSRIADALQSFRQQARDSGLNPLANTTLTAGWIHEEGPDRYLALAQIGDSRAYVLFKDGDIRQLTRDQSLANYLFGSEYPDIADYIDEKIQSARNIHELENDEGWAEKWRSIAPAEQEAIRVKLQAKFPSEQNVEPTLLYFLAKRNETFAARGSSPVYHNVQLTDDVRGVLFTTDGIPKRMTRENMAQMYAKTKGNASDVAEALVGAVHQQFITNQPQFLDDLSAVVVLLPATQ